MSEQKRNITKEDILLKARILSEGVRITEEAKAAGAASPAECVLEESYFEMGRPIVLDGCDLVVATRSDPRSRLQMHCDGADVSIVDGGEVLATGQVQQRLQWWDAVLSDATPIEMALPGMQVSVINIVFYYSCYNWNNNNGCRYCGLFASPLAQQMADLPDSTLVEFAMRQAEGLKVATDNGWRGTVFVAGGALPPKLPRDKVLQKIETVLKPIRDTLDSSVLSELNMVFNHYPPDDFKEMETWKDLGIDATAFDLEVMDPAFFAAICPGKQAAYPIEYWKEAQIASTEIFGPGRGTTTSVILGMEPMETLLAGVEECVSNGVFSIPFVFIPTPGSAYESFMPPKAEWLVEATERIVDLLVQHADKLGTDPMADARAGMTRTGLSFHAMLLGDEITRRAQEKGVFPAGLPRQDCVEPAVYVKNC